MTPFTRTFQMANIDPPALQVLIDSILELSKQQGLNDFGNIINILVISNITNMYFVFSRYRCISRITINTVVPKTVQVLWTIIRHQLRPEPKIFVSILRDKM